MYIYISIVNEKNNENYRGCVHNGAYWPKVAKTNGRPFKTIIIIEFIPCSKNENK